MMRSLFLALLLSGCVQALPQGAERPPRASDLVVIDKIASAWRAAGNPWTAQCRQERRDRLVVIRAERSVGGYCAAAGPCCGTPAKQSSCGCLWAQGGMGCAAGATTREADWIQPIAGLAQRWRVMIWISAHLDEQTQRRVIAHEYVHALGTCSLEDPDRLHARTGWWGAQGIESSGW